VPTAGIRPSKPAAHLLEVRCSLAAPDPAGQRFALPAWIPGSYLIRDFARHIVAIRAEAAGKAVALTKLDKHSWQAAPLGKGVALTVICEVYAWDLSVRAAHVDQTHAFFNGSSVFLRALGHEHLPCLVDIQRPIGRHFEAWRVATALTPACHQTARRHAFGLYRAANYDELIDHPVAMGTFTLATFTACGVPHEIAISGRHDCDLARLSADLQRICEWQIRFFGEPAPMPHYVFLVTAVDEAYGGLEHRASTALLCARDDLPYPGMRGTPKRYRSFPRSVQPRVLPQLERQAHPARGIHRLQSRCRELHHPALGLRGFHLVLRRPGAAALRLDRSWKDWLELVARTIDKVQRDPGRKRQTLAESSFDAWTKYYRPDENTPNAVVSYYAKGALVALALDLTLRAGTREPGFPRRRHAHTLATLWPG
jgi:predicted metalloprotease with PDZ domain